MSNTLAALVIAATLPGIFGEGFVGSSGNTVVLVNATGLKVIRVVIADKTYEDLATKNDKVLISVTPKKHNMELVFRGGTHIDWPHFDFRDIHQITFELIGNRISAYTK